MEGDKSKLAIHPPVSWVTVVTSWSKRCPQRGAGLWRVRRPVRVAFVREAMFKSGPGIRLGLSEGSTDQHS